MSRKTKHGASTAAPQTLTLLTATGARPEAWAICEKLMAAQDYPGPVRWVIVDDGPEPQPLAFQRDGWSLEVLRPEPFWQPGQNTQARNLTAGLARIGADERVVIVEDDDYYASDYLGAVAQWLAGAELVGEGGARYYNVASRLWHDFGTASPHASLCSTAVRGPALATLRKVLAADAQFIDMRLWRDFRGRKALYPPARVVGIKGLPGRGGIGVGHRMNGRPDPQGQKLAEWLGSAAALYQQAAGPRTGLQGFASQFTDQAVGTMPPPRPGVIVRPIAFVGRERATNTPAAHIFGSGLATAAAHPFVVASIYADTARDAAHAQALGQALERLHIRFFIAKAEGQESWTGDGALKANYLHNLWKESDAPVAWLDIDTPVEALPGWFSSMEADFAVHNRSWEAGLQTTGPLDLSSGAIWFGKSPLAGELLAQWEQRCQADPGTPEATHLAAAWFDISARLPLRTIWLPRTGTAGQALSTSSPAPELVQLLTPTGCRPDTFALCARWMARQSWRGPVRWIIVDDGEVAQPLPAMPVNWELVVIRPQPFWREGGRTQPRNFMAGLDAALTDSPVIVIEDDDWYAPDYLEITMQRLRQHSMVAVGPQRWSNVKLQTCGEYSALQWPWSSQLAFRAEAIPHVRSIISSRESYIDRDTWNEWQGSKQLFRDGRVVGIKGLPGRSGYMSVHHRAEGRPDPELRQLQQWIGADVAAYRQPAVQTAQAASASVAAATGATDLKDLVLQLVSGKAGLEIGGPSRRFSSRGILPVYPVLGACDCTNFQDETLWEKGLGRDFAPEGRNLGRRTSSEMTDLKFADAAYEFILSSHALEHSANPIKALRESFRVLKAGGTLVLILPERAATFDHRRSVTTFEHLLDDERSDTGEDDLTHLEEILALHDLERDKPAGNIHQFRARSLGNLENRGLHQHVFDMELATKAVEYAGFEVQSAGLMTEMDLVVVARKPAGARAAEGVTTLIPAYKSQYFPQLLISLKAQTQRPQRILVSDDSPDRAFFAALGQEPCKSLARGLNIEVVQGPRAGAQANCQHLMKLWDGSTELVHVLFDDDLLYPDFYAAHVAAHATGAFECTISRRWTALESGQPVGQLRLPRFVAQHAGPVVSVDSGTAFSTTVPEYYNWFGEMSNAVFSHRVANRFVDARLGGISFIGLGDLGFFLAASLVKPLGFIRESLGCFRTSPEQTTGRPQSHEFKASVIACAALALGGVRIGKLSTAEANRCYERVRSRIDSRYKESLDVQHFAGLLASLVRDDPGASELFIEAWHAFIPVEADGVPYSRAAVS